MNTSRIWAAGALIPLGTAAALPAQRADSGLFRLVTFEAAGALRLGATQGDADADIVDVHNAVLALRDAGAPEGHAVAYIPPDMRGLFEARSDSLAAVRAAYRAIVALRAAGRLNDRPVDRRVFYPPSSVKLHAPVPNPSKMFGLAGNYPREGALANPKPPSAFLKSVSSLVGHEATIDLAGLITKGVHEPGDVVQTGVPAPVVPLRAGDVVEITIERLGTLRNRVVAKAAPTDF